MQEHEAFQPQPEFIKHHKDDRQCPYCGGRMTRRSKCCMECSRWRPTLEQPSDSSFRLIPLTQGKVAEVSTARYDYLMQWLWCAKKNGRGGYYAVRVEYVDGKYVFIQMHRVIMGVTDPAIQVDHVKPKETLNNRDENLRLSTPSQNQANRSTNRSRSGYKGVAFVGKRKERKMEDGWRAELVLNGKRYISPTVYDPVVAARAYDAMAVKYFGEFARTNFPIESHIEYPPPEPPAEIA